MFRSKWIRVVALVAAVTVFAAACGDDDSDATGQSNSGDSSTTTTGSGEDSTASPSQGGSATILTAISLPSLDPVTFSASSAVGAHESFSLYGALVTLNPETMEIEPLLAESFDMVDDDPARWRLVLLDGIVFSDGSPFDAAAVQVNWERIAKPESRSPGTGTAAAVQTFTVVDDLTLDLTLRAPNAHFDLAVQESALNFIASADAIAAGHDLTSDPVGAGPFILKEWLRDDHLTLARNPDWFDAPGPFLDEITFRPIGIEDQRTDTFVTGGGDLLYSLIPGSIERALEGSGTTSASVQQSSSNVFIFNTSKPPFDDARVRRAVVIGVDWKGLNDVVYGSEEFAPSGFALEDSPWWSDSGALPEHDPEEAARLIEEVEAETGTPVKFIVSSGPGEVGVVSSKFVQTAMSNLGADVEAEARDIGTMIGRVLQNDFDMNFWGIGFIDPEPKVFNNTRGGIGSNHTGYASADVDTALDAARVSLDADERAALYQDVFGVLAEDLPWVPVTHAKFQVVAAEHMTGVELFNDGILRTDKVGHR